MIDPETIARLRAKLNTAECCDEPSVLVLTESLRGLLDAAERLSAVEQALQESFDEINALHSGEPLPSGKFPHRITCSGGNRQPLLGDCCSCMPWARKLREQLAAVQAEALAREQWVRDVESFHDIPSNGTDGYGAIAQYIKTVKAERDAALARCDEHFADVRRINDWLDTRKSPELAFTAGPERTIASMIMHGGFEQSSDPGPVDAIRAAWSRVAGFAVCESCAENLYRVTIDYRSLEQAQDAYRAMAEITRLLGCVTKGEAK